MNKSGEPSVTQLIKSINKFDGTKYIEWTRSTRAIISLMHPGIADILNGVERPVEITDGDFSEADQPNPAARRMVTRSQTARVQPSTNPVPTPVVTNEGDQTIPQVEEPTTSEVDQHPTRERSSRRVSHAANRLAPKFLHMLLQIEIYPPEGKSSSGGMKFLQRRNKVPLWEMFQILVSTGGMRHPVTLEGGDWAPSGGVMCTMGALLHNESPGEEILT